jgi:hypothetical protein
MGDMTPDNGVFKRKGSDVWQHRVFIPKDVRDHYGGKSELPAKSLGLPLVAIPGIKLEPGRYRPASGLAGAKRRRDWMLAARSSLEPVADSRAMSAV